MQNKTCFALALFFVSMATPLCWRPALASRGRAPTPPKPTTVQEAQQKIVKPSTKHKLEVVDNQRAEKNLKSYRSGEMSEKAASEYTPRPAPTPKEVPKETPVGRTF